MARRARTITLYRDLRRGLLHGEPFSRRGLDVADDPDGYRPAPPSMPLSLGGGAYFSLDETYALGLARTGRYRNGLVMVELLRATFVDLV
jgi:hypothetical protein